MNKQPNQEKENDRTDKSKEVDDNLPNAENRKARDKSEKRGEKDGAVLGKINDS